MKKTTLYSIIAIVVAVALTIILAVGSSGFTNWNVKTWFKGDGQNSVQPADPNTPSDIAEDSQFSGGMLVSDGEENGISILSAKLPRAAYAANGISTQADSAYLLTVNVYPDTATNKEMDWSVAWIDANSGFAKGKSVSDYVTVSPTSDGALTANITCKQPFGSQIKVNVVSRDNPDATAQCTLDYSQKVQSVSLKFGDLVANLGGTTEVKFNINPNGNGPGGATNLQFEKSSVYTVADEFTASISLSYDISPDTGLAVFLKLKDKTITTGNYTENIATEQYFDYAHSVSKFMIMGRNSDILFKNLSTSEIADYFSNITEGRLFNVNVTVTGQHSTYTISSKFVCTGYINQARVSSVGFDTPSVIL